MNLSSYDVLIGCETSGAVREACWRRGIRAVSCDLLPADDGSPHHIQADVFDVAGRRKWAFAVFHPTCTYLTYAAEWAYSDPDFLRYPGKGYHQKVKPGTLTGAARREARKRALDDVRRLMMLGVPTLIENPRGAICKHIVRRSQVIQPYQFGDNASKETHLWTLHGAEPLRIWPHLRVAGRMVNGRERWENQTDSGQNRLSPGEDRWKERSKTYPGIAEAIADAILRTLIRNGVAKLPFCC